MYNGMIIITINADEYGPSIETTLNINDYF